MKTFTFHVYLNDESLEVMKVSVRAEGAVEALRKIEHFHFVMAEVVEIDGHVASFDELYGC